MEMFSRTDGTGFLGMGMGGEERRGEEVGEGFY